MIFWFTGQPGSGKTTLGKALLDKLNDAFHIDGDDLRGLSANADYSELGFLLITVTAITLILPIGTVIIIQHSRFRTTD